MSKICVIVPVYKVEKYLNRCVDSILNQTFTDFELILVDDGSPDNCGKICDEYAKKDNRIVVIHKENGGLSDARNAGIDWAFKNSDSEWLAFIDSDDWVHPQYLEVLYNANIQNDTLISVCGYLKTYTETNVYNNINDRAEVVVPENFWVNDITNATVAWGKLYKKELFKTIRYPVSKIHEDAYTTHKLLFQVAIISFNEAKLYFYFQNENGITGKWNIEKAFNEVSAYESQVNYFRRNKFDNALLVSALVCIDTLAENIRIIDDINSYKVHVKCFRKKLRHLLRRYSKRLKIDRFANKYYYNTAYPVETKTVKYVKRKFKHIKMRLKVKK